MAEIELRQYTGSFMTRIWQKLSRATGKELWPTEAGGWLSVMQKMYKEPSKRAELAAAETALVEVEPWARGAALKQRVLLEMWGRGPWVQVCASPNTVLWNKFQKYWMLRQLYSEHPCVYHLDPLQALDFNF